jgi:hypothetical protein
LPHGCDQYVHNTLYKAISLNCNVLKFISENEVWSTEEVEKYLNALIKCDKDFCSISKEVLF